MSLCIGYWFSSIKKGYHHWLSSFLLQHTFTVNQNSESIAINEFLMSHDVSSNIPWLIIPFHYFLNLYIPHLTFVLYYLLQQISTNIEIGIGVIVAIKLYWREQYFHNFLFVYVDVTTKGKEECTCSRRWVLISVRFVLCLTLLSQKGDDKISQMVRDEIILYNEWWNALRLLI